MDVLKLAAQVEDFPPVTDRIALANGTLYLDGTFQEGKPEIVRNRLPVKYDPKAPQPPIGCGFCPTCSTRRTSPPCRSSSATA